MTWILGDLDRIPEAFAERPPANPRSDLLSNRLAREPDILWRQVSRGAVLVGKTGGIVRISHAGLAVWLCLEAPRSVDEIVEVLAVEFSADPALLKNDVLQTVIKFRDLGLVAEIG